jgi:ferritin
MIMMQATYFLASMILLLSIVQTSSVTFDPELGKCLSKLATEEISVSYNYLQLSSKFGASNAYPGFSSFFTKLSDEDSSKGHDLVKFIALRRAENGTLIQGGIKLREGLSGKMEIRQGLTKARHQNKDLWEQVRKCHEKSKDANVQDYLESHLLDHHIEIDKHLADIEHRIDDANPSEKKLIIFMIDEELLQTYGDRRKDIFS